MPFWVGNPFLKSIFPTRASTLGGSLSGSEASLPDSWAIDAVRLMISLYSFLFLLPRAAFLDRYFTFSISPEPTQNIQLPLSKKNQAGLEVGCCFESAISSILTTSRNLDGGLADEKGCAPVVGSAAKLAVFVRRSA